MQIAEFIYLLILFIKYPYGLWYKAQIFSLESLLSSLFWSPKCSRQPSFNLFILHQQFMQRTIKYKFNLFY
jgi:hypothetical protein